MRTTLTLEPDVTARLEECQAADLSISFKELVNGLLRMGLAKREATARKTAVKRFATKVFRGRKTMLGALTSTHDMLAMEHGLVRVSADSDFRLFPGLRVEDPTI